MTTKIPILDLKTQTRDLEEEVMAAFRRILADACFIKGPDVRSFQEEFASFIGTRRAIGVANGTDALVLALRALDIGPGDEVVTTPFSFMATAESVSLVGATPVFADIDPGTFNLCPARVAEKITPRTRAIIGVHLYGQPCDALAFRALADRHGIAFIEDCAQATGALLGGRRIGSFGDFGCFSFFPSKNLGAFGDGGAVTTSRDDMADKIVALADHGSRVRYMHDMVGTNSRLDTLQAAVLRIKLPRIDGWNARRREVAARYTRNFASTGIVAPIEMPDTTCVYHQYTIRVPRHRDAVHKALNETGITCVIYYPQSLHLQPVYQALGYRAGICPNAEAVQHEVLSLPIYPELTDAQIDEISARVVECFAACERATGTAHTSAAPAPTGAA